MTGNPNPNAVIQTPHSCVYYGSKPKIHCYVAGPKPGAKNAYIGVSPRGKTLSGARSVTRNCTIQLVKKSVTLGAEVKAQVTSIPIPKLSHGSQLAGCYLSIQAAAVLELALASRGVAGLRGSICIADQ